MSENELAPAYRTKILTILGDPQKSALLQVELAVIVDTGEHFVKATYTLEGNGLLVYTCFEILSGLNAAIQGFTPAQYSSRHTSFFRV